MKPDEGQVAGIQNEEPGEGILLVRTKQGSRE